MLPLLILVASLQPPQAADLLPASPVAPGCVLDVRQNGVVREQAVTGLANLETSTLNQADTVFEAGSVSKQFIGAGIAILAEEGRLNVEDPIAKWLPELPTLYRDVTISMLLHHTSGIRSWNNLAELTGRGEDSTGYDNAWVLRSVARQKRLNHAPGAEFLYSNSNFVLAAIIIERASGQALNAFYLDRLFARLGMTQTSWRTDYRIVVPGRAQAYLPNDHGSWQLDVPLNGVVGAGGLLTTVGDLQRWAATLAEPTSADRRWVDRLLRTGRLPDGTELNYGLGIEAGTIAGAAAFSHAGATGSYRAWLGLLPAQRISVALLCNSGAVNTEELGPEIAARFITVPAATPQAHSRVMVAPADLAGRYRNATNDSAVDATIDADGLHFNRGVGFGLVAHGRLETANAQRWVTVRRSRNGKVSSLRVSRVGNAPIMLYPAAPWIPRRADLKALVGSYRSTEIDGEQKIELTDDTLIWRDPGGIKHPLKPLYRAAFEAPEASWTLRFIPHGRIQMQLDMSITRARRIAFQRVKRAVESRRVK